MRWLLLFLVILILIGGGLKLAGAQIPGLDFPFGGLFGQPQIRSSSPTYNCRDSVSAAPCSSCGIRRRHGCHDRLCMGKPRWRSLAN